MLVETIIFFKQKILLYIFVYSPCKHCCVSLLCSISMSYFGETERPPSLKSRKSQNNHIEVAWRTRYRTCNTGIISFSQQCWGFIWAICQDHSKEKTEQWSHIQRSHKHCRYTFKAGNRVLGGGGLAEKHTEEYWDLCSIFKSIHKNLFPLRDKNPILKFWKQKCLRGKKERLV